MLGKTNRSSRGRKLAALLVCLSLVVMTGCFDLFGDIFGTSDGYDTSWNYDDGYYSNWYTDTTMNGDDEGFYIAGDGFTYISGW